MAFDGKLGSVQGRAMVAFLTLLGLLNSAHATLYTVGGKAGWALLPLDSAGYDAQFKNTKLAVGDQLLFAFLHGVHNVYQVSSEQLKDCDGSSPIAIFSATNATITLSSPGYWGFICEVPHHCTVGGMHLAVNVADSSSPGTIPAGAAPAPTPTSSTAAPTESPASSPSETVGMGLKVVIHLSGASSLVSATFAVFLATFLVLLIVLL